MPGFNINNFISNINANGVMRNNKFLVRVYTPLGFYSSQSILTETGKYMEFWCDSASIPGVMLNTKSVHRYGYGHEEKRPHLPQFADVNLSFLSDAKGAIWTFFQQWIKLIYNYDLSDGVLKSNGVVRGQLPMEISYKENYAVNVEIFVFKETGEQILSVMLREAYPVALGAVALNWGDTNNIVKIDVGLTYFDWYNTDTKYNKK